MIYPSFTHQSHASGNIQVILTSNKLHDPFLSEQKMFLYFYYLMFPATLKKKNNNKKKQLKVALSALKGVKKAYF